MNGLDKKSFTNEENAGGEARLGSFIARLALRTLIVFLVFFSMLITLIGYFFPKAYMEMYRSFEAYGKAALFARAAAAHAASSHPADCDGSCEYGSLLIQGLGLADLADNAGLVYTFADEYLSVSCHAERSAKLDAGAVKEYAATDFTRLSLVYGFDDYVAGKRIGAMCALGDKPLGDADYAAKATEEVTAEVNGYTPQSSADKTYLLNVLTAYLDGGENLGLDAAFVSGVTAVYEGLTAYTDGLDAAQGADRTSAARKAGLLYRLYGLADSMRNRGIGTEEAKAAAWTAYADFIRSVTANETT